MNKHWKGLIMTNGLTVNVSADKSAIVDIEKIVPRKLWDDARNGMGPYWKETEILKEIKKRISFFLKQIKDIERFRFVKNKMEHELYDSNFPKPLWENWWIDLCVSLEVDLNQKIRKEIANPKH